MSRFTFGQKGKVSNGESNRRCSSERRNVREIEGKGKGTDD